MKIKMRNLFISSLLGLFVLPSLALGQPSTAYIPVGTARTKKTVIAMPDIRSSGVNGTSFAKQIFETVQHDLTFIELFKFLPSQAFIEAQTSSGIAPGSFKMSDWTSIGAEFLVKSALGTDGNNLTVETYLYDTHGAKQILAKRYVAFSKDAKTVAHTMANDVVTALTGLPGIFQTRIAMSCDRTQKKEIYIMAFDGSNVKQVTKHRSIAFAPAWSPDGTKIAYSLYNRHKNNVKNIDLFEYDFTKEEVKLLSNRKGINSGAAYSPDGTKLALTMSFPGNPEIFILDPLKKEVTAIARSFGVDVDPSWSPDARKIAFVSSRTGMPMVYSAHVDGSNIQRLTFAGRFNATPSWSPQNNKIAFAGWIDGRFDIFTMNTDGSNIERLTKNQGNNEDPHFSPDGNFLVFSSNRTGQKNIYIMNIDGTFVRRLTYGLGNCVSPKWSSPPQTN